MSQRPGGRPGPSDNDRDEARQKLAAAKTDLAKQTRAAQKTFSHAVMLANDRIALCKRELKALAPKLAKVEPLKGHPDGVFLLNQLKMLQTVYTSIQAMMEVDLDCNSYNLELTENLARLDQGEDFRSAGRYLTYQEARSRLDLALTYYLWTTMLDGADALLRATRNERAVVPRTAEEDAMRQARADELRVAFKADRDLAILAGTLASGVAEAQELMEWGLGALPALDTRNAQVKRELLSDTRWAKLNGKLQSVIMELPKRSRFYPALSKLFPVHVDLTLPFAAVEGAAEASGEMLPSGGQPPAPLAAVANPGAASAAMRAALSAASRGKGGDSLSLGATRPLGPRPSSPGSSPLGPGPRSPSLPLGPRQAQTAPLGDRHAASAGTDRQLPLSSLDDRALSAAAGTDRLPPTPAMADRVAAASSGGSALRLPPVGAPRLPGSPGAPLRPAAGRPLLPGQQTKPLPPVDPPPGVPKRPGT